MAVTVGLDPEPETSTVATARRHEPSAPEASPARPPLALTVTVIESIPNNVSNPTDRLIIGTAGHIDHGKSTLVRSLTGVDPDRLKEEKERGITIVLGFAPLDLPSGRRCGVVDVPGHERLVRTMIAGATGIDLLLLVVAADEGVMPQTREHLAICELLGVRQGVVALTKTDLVDDEWLELVRSDLASELRGSFLEKAPVVACSATTGQGLDELLATLDRVADKAERRSVEGLLRLPIDRSFIMKGFGTVVTGTLLSGRVQVGDSVEALPSGATGKVRGLQVHGAQVQHSVAGTRTAVNVQGAGAAGFKRGEWLVHPDSIDVSRRLDVRARLLSIYPKPLGRRTHLLVHAGTTHVEAVMSLLEGETLEPGQEAYAHLELSGPLLVLPGDRLIFRGTQRLAHHGHTIGGAVVIRPSARRPRKRAKTLAEVQALDRAETDEERLALVVHQAGPGGIEWRELLMRTGLGSRETRSLLKKLAKEHRLVAFGQSGVIHGDHLAWLERTALDRITAYHEANPLEPGMPREELRSKLPGVSPALFGLVLEALRHGPDAVVENDLVRRSDFKPGASHAGVEQLKRDILGRLADGGLTPPRDKELSEALGVGLAEVRAALKLLVADGRIAKVAEGLFFAVEHLDDLRARVIEHLERHEKLTAQEFKTLTGASRKFTIPLAEYFDKEKLTMRVGDARVLRRKPGRGQ